MKFMRYRSYWEQVRDEVETVIEESGLLDEQSIDEISVEDWEMARKEAVARLYLRGIFKDIGF